MKTTILVVSFILLAAKMNAQTFCFYDPNTGPLYHNSSQGIFDITSGDFNGDGHLDIVTANSTGANISFVPGYGNGTLGSPDTISLPGVLFCITSGDFNGDNNLDIATSNAANVYVLLGNGNGTFQPWTAYSGGSSSRLYCRDINNDSIQDLIAPETGIFVFIGQGNGSFLPAAQYPTAGSDIDLTIADFDNDSVLDIVSTTNITWTLSVLSFLKGNANGIFSPAVSISVPHYSIFGINAIDVDNNGMTDLIVSNHNNSIHRVEIYHGNGNGTFNSPVLYPVSYNPNYVYLADLNNDQIKDIVVPEASGYSILSGNSNGTFNAFQYFVAASNPNAIAVGDYNEDGKTDFINPHGGIGIITVNLNCTVTGIDEGFQDKNTQMRIFPNPFSTYTAVQFPSSINNAELNIFNVYRQKVKTIKNISEKEIKLDRSNLACGIYFINLTQDNKIIANEKLVITE